MVRFTVHNLGEHTIDNLLVSGPFRSIIMEMADMFLATCTGPAGPDDKDLDYQFAEYIIKMSYGQGRILEWTPNPPEATH
ncbi:hypothetical protein FCL47_15475 [Desulfopila sp. IMCC35006]|uniref:hypothetical protein n=1 Tax=Desulfopila sp. IMCC35006 TaxID=2569542 RepID=UPI0010AD6CB9|nr:hypothetical protein [Desulfopila sp. IMCC35006]TKB25047.1 hypothetical protein FCL47_15475 [Desulfopila sp. IMCC35006]